MDNDGPKHSTDIKGPSHYQALVLPLQSNDESSPLLQDPDHRKLSPQHADNPDMQDVCA
jgi:hypothetical protein